MMKLQSIDSFYIKNRGRVFTVVLEKDMDNDELNKLFNDKVHEIDGKKHKVIGVERYLISRHLKGEKIGLLVC